MNQSLIPLEVRKIVADRAQLIGAQASMDYSKALMIACSIDPDKELARLCADQFAHECAGHMLRAKKIVIRSDHTEIVAKAEMVAMSRDDFLILASEIFSAGRADWAHREMRPMVATTEDVGALRKALAKAIKAADGWHDDTNGGDAPDLDDERKLLAQG